MSPEAGDMTAMGRRMARPIGIGAKVGRSASSEAARTSGVPAGTAGEDGAGRAGRELGAAMSARRP